MSSCGSTSSDSQASKNAVKKLGLLFALGRRRS